LIQLFQPKRIKSRLLLPETATPCLLASFLKNEAVKKLAQDFITASMKWVRSWFLTGGPGHGKPRRVQTAAPR